MEELRKFNLRTIIFSIVLIALGIIIIVNPNGVLSVVIKILGIGVILDGVWHAIKFFSEAEEDRALSPLLVQGVGEIFLGIIAIANSLWVISILYIVIGFCIVMESIFKIQMTVYLKNTVANWWVPLVIAVIGLIVGIFVIAHPLTTSDYINTAIGITIIIAEIPSLIDSIYLARKLK